MTTTNPFTTDNYMKAVDELKTFIAKQADEIERLRDAIADMKRNIRTVDRMFMKESTQEILDSIEEED